MKARTAFVELDGGTLTLNRVRLSELLKAPYAPRDSSESFSTEMQLSGWAAPGELPDRLYESTFLRRAVLNTGFATFEIRDVTLLRVPEFSGDGYTPGLFMKIHWDHHIETEEED